MTEIKTPAIGVCDSCETEDVAVQSYHRDAFAPGKIEEADFNLCDLCAGSNLASRRIMFPRNHNPYVELMVDIIRGKHIERKRDALNAPEINVDKVAEILTKADSYLSLIACRYCQGCIPDDLRRELSATSGECRTLAAALLKEMEA